MTASYKLGRAEDTCRCCGIRFANDQVCVSALQENKEGELIRRDLCMPCWESSGTSCFSFWQTRYRSGAGKAVDEQALYALFKDLLSKDDERAQELVYVLSLYLSRKKTLELLDVRIDETGRETLIFQGPERDRDVHIKDPALTAERVEELSDSITTLLGLDQRIKATATTTEKHTDS